MTLELRNPLVFFDLETTGINITQDRIIDGAFIKLLPDGQKEKKLIRVNPEIPIPPESSMIHGIYDEDVKDAPTFKTVAQNLANWLKGCDLSGFNILKFDVPMLVEEFLRAGIDLDFDHRKVIDAQKIFHLMEKRTLSAAYLFYCQKSLENAHSAEADTEATMEVLQAQIQKYNGQTLTDLAGNPVGVIQNDVTALHDLFNEKMIDYAGRLSYDNEGNAVINFGKHKGKKVHDVLNQETGYYDWMMRSDFPLDTKRKLTKIKLDLLNNA
jgi:DNA polymerase-3 subunit epsilon